MRPGPRPGPVAADVEPTARAGQQSRTSTQHQTLGIGEVDGFVEGGEVLGSEAGLGLERLVLVLVSGERGCSRAYAGELLQHPGHTTVEATGDHRNERPGGVTCVHTLERADVAEEEDDHHLVPEGPHAVVRGPAREPAGLVVDGGSERGQDAGHCRRASRKGSIGTPDSAEVRRGHTHEPPVVAPRSASAERERRALILAASGSIRRTYVVRIPMATPEGLMYSRISSNLPSRMWKTRQ